MIYVCVWSYRHWWTVTLVVRSAGGRCSLADCHWWWVITRRCSAILCCCRLYAEGSTQLWVSWYTTFDDVIKLCVLCLWQWWQCHCHDASLVVCLSVSLSVSVSVSLSHFEPMTFRCILFILSVLVSVNFDRYQHVQSANIVWNVLLLCLRLLHGTPATKQTCGTFVMWTWYRCMVKW